MFSERMSNEEMSRQEWIDLRSDTVTKPGLDMRVAMANAEVGDDVYGEDPTVNELETRAAEIFGKEAALFVPTGTMGNTIAIKLHTSHGEEVICEARSHIVDWELSMMAWFAGCIARTISTADGLLSWQQIEPVLRAPGFNNAPTTLISLENTHNMAGGTVYSQAALDEICGEAHQRGLKVHTDGARVFNASVASGIAVARMTRDVDSVMFCLSKGLGAPVGSILAGTASDIARGRLYRKRLGGGMRQAGILAAAGLLALERRGQLESDHDNAKWIAHRLAAIPGVHINPASVETNIVIFNIAGLGISTTELSQRLKAERVLINGIDPLRMRIVTHCDVSREQCGRALDVLAEVLAPVASSPFRMADRV